jgi:hypothetical protein
MSSTPPPIPQSDRSPYRRLWTATAGATVGLGCICGLLAWGTWLWVYAVLAVAMLALLLAPHGDAPGVHRPARSAVRIVAVAVAASGLTGVLGWAGLGWVLLVAAAHPAVVGRLARTLEGDRPDVVTGHVPMNLAEAGRGVDAPSGGRLAQLPAAEVVGTLDDEALCQAWRRSFVHLTACRLPSRRLELVSLRQAYLDELGRRHPAAVDSWLASGARAASNPMPFLERHLEGAPRDGRDDIPGPGRG